MDTSLGAPQRQLAIGSLVFLLGCAALVAPFLLGKLAPAFLGLLLIAAGVLEILYGFGVFDRRGGESAFLGSATSIVAGLLLLALPKLALGGMALLLGLSFVIDGIGTVILAARSHKSVGRVAWMFDGLFSLLLGVLIGSQWPVSGLTVIGLSVGLRLVSSGWSMVVGRGEVLVPTEAEAARLHPDTRLGLPPHDELSRLREAVVAQDQSRGAIDLYWRGMFILTFFAIHVGRMDADWNLVGFLSPGVAVVGDVLYALLLAWFVVTPLQLAWRRLTRPVERWAWRSQLAGVDAGRSPRVRDRLVRQWLNLRYHRALHLRACRHSPAAALGRGLQIGLPLTAVLIALNPVWGLSWYFNTENWATGAWEMWAEVRVDTWRSAMTRAVRTTYPDVAEADLFRIAPEGVAGTADFSFLVIGDTGEGDESQHVLRDRFILLGQRPDVKFLVVSSDVIYPSGAMKDYEPKFYLPFKGFAKPIVALPGNHDWYDALEAFGANFLEAPAARAALQARRTVDGGLTTTTERRIDQLIDEAARLRGAYGIDAARQRAPYFEIQADRFALLAIDTGIQKTTDDEQLTWLHGALARSRGKLTMAIVGHPLYAEGRDHGIDDEPFAALYQLLREQGVAVAMAGDTHSLEYYREQLLSAPGPMHHFVNGGGGAYLSIGTPLDWPRRPAVPDSAFYPRRDALVAKLGEQTPLWKQPLWFWVHRLGAWPSSAEGLASAFDYNRAPFFQSFVEVRVEGTANRVRIIPHGVSGPLRWSDFQRFGDVVPSGSGENDTVEWVVPMPAKM